MSKVSIEQVLNTRGVTIERIAELVYVLARPFNDQLQPQHCVESVYAVLDKQEVQQTLYTGIALDEMAERRLFPQSLQALLEAGEPLGGVDETLALGFVRLYGARSVAGFEHLNKKKQGIVGTRNETMNKASEGDCIPIHVFLDDLVAGLAAAAAARISCGNHVSPDGEVDSTQPLRIHAEG